VPLRPPMLNGIVVVAVEQAVAAPLATRHLADMGARVIKVERRDGGDFARYYDASVHGLASHFVWLNRGKESVTLDITQPAGLAVLADLIARADVFVQNLAPGVAARLGFDSADLRTRHPRLVTVDVSGYGSSGPYADRRAYDMLVQCEAGVAAVTGTPEAPAKAGVPLSDIAGGMYAVTSVLAALFARERTGIGAQIEVSLFDATAEWMGYQLHYTGSTGIEPQRSGLSHPSISPYDSYPTSDGNAVVIGIQNDREWARFAAEFLARPDLAADPDVATNVARVTHRGRVDAVIADVTRTMTLVEARNRLDASGIANADLTSVQGLLDHPQLAARDRWRTVETPGGPVRAVLPPAVIADLPMQMGPVPGLGEHTDDVLQWLGYDVDRIAELRRQALV
jgi:itaconate CoA-transferase